jgi:hypothetical protein
VDLDVPEVDAAGKVSAGDHRSVESNATEKTGRFFKLENNRMLNYPNQFQFVFFLKILFLISF